MTTPARKAYGVAVDKAIKLHGELEFAGQHSIALAMLTSIDLGTSAAFLFTTEDSAFRDATAIVDAAVAQATESYLRAVVVRGGDLA